MIRAYIFAGVVAGFAVTFAAGAIYGKSLAAKAAADAYAETIKRLGNAETVDPADPDSLDRILRRLAE
jgi:hypothetical protein